FRWVFGTLQCLRKHRSALGRYGWVGRGVMPSLWLFQIAYQALSPFVDLQVIWSVGWAVQAWASGMPLVQSAGTLYFVAALYVGFFLLEFCGAALALYLDG